MGGVLRRNKTKTDLKESRVVQEMCPMGADLQTVRISGTCDGITVHMSYLEADCCSVGKEI